ncbi:MAG TPA: hypothetical protein VLA58_05215, partial [Chitinophagaceae bacterium]|nr:hypothetical protein [Chitinophagaceae bacterium]
MRSTLRNSVANLFAFATLFFSGLQTFAQAPDPTNIRNYLFFGNDRLDVSSANIGTAGYLGGYKTVRITASGTIGAGLYSWGSLELTNGSTISGSVAVRNVPQVSPAFRAGSGTVITGDLDVRGDVSIRTNGGSRIDGGIYVPAAFAYSGPNATKRQSTSPLITLNTDGPVFPGITAYPTANAVAPVNTNNTFTLTPGVRYSTLNLSAGNSTVLFNGPGVYYIDAIAASGSNTFMFDFVTNDLLGAFKIVVRDNAMMGKVNAQFTRAGTNVTASQVAARIYTEVQGQTTNANSPAFDIANGASTSKSRWLGSVYTPKGSINIGSGTGNTDFFGSLWTGRGSSTVGITNLTVNSGVNTTHLPLTPIPTFVSVTSASVVGDGTPKTLTTTVTNFFNQNLTSPAVQFYYSTDGGVTETNSASAPGVYRVRAVYPGDGGTNSPSEGIGTLTITSPNCTTPIAVNFVTTGDFKTFQAIPNLTATGELICKPASATQQWKLQIDGSTIPANSTITWSTLNGNFYPGTATTGTLEAFATMAGKYQVTVVNGICTTIAEINVTSCVLSVNEEYKIDNDYDPNNPTKGRVLDAPLKKYSETPIDPYAHFPQYGELPMISLKGTKVLIDLSIKDDFKNRPSDAWSYLDGILFEPLVYEDVKFQGIAARLVTGWVERDKLQDVNLKIQWFNYARFTIRPQTNNINNEIPGKAVDPFAGRKIISGGDSAQKSSIVRYGYSVDGSGIKVGVISDSYDKSGTANPTLQNDVDRGD